MVPAGSVKSSSPKPNAAMKSAPVKDPKLELEGKRWAVEYFKNNSGLVIEETETNQTIYMYRYV